MSLPLPPPLKTFLRHAFGVGAPRYPRPDIATTLIGPRVILRIGQSGDWRHWRNVREASYPFLAPWEPLWPEDALSYDSFAGALRRQTREWREGKAHTFFIFLKPKEQREAKEEAATTYIFSLPLCGEGREGGSPASTTLSTPNTPLPTGPLVGGIALTDIQRGIAQKGTIGYWMGAPYANQGLMTEALTLVTRFAFETLNLHRVEASSLPHNLPSNTLLKKSGFTQEGLAEKYLRIAGKWEDHLLWGKVREEN